MARSVTASPSAAVRAAVAALTLTLGAVAACAAAPGAPAARNVSDARDCAVMTAVLRQHYEISAGSRMHIQRGDPRTDDPVAFRITCDFAAAGAPLADYDYSHAPDAHGYQGWIGFQKPRFDRGGRATIETGAVAGPLAGSGARCILSRTGAGWRVDACTMTWIS